jgi:hypothetical protein
MGLDLDYLSQGLGIRGYCDYVIGVRHYNVHKLYMLVVISRVIGDICYRN